MSDRGNSRPSSRHNDRSITPSGVSDGRSPMERIRSLERRRNMDWTREQLRREQGLRLPETAMSIGERVMAEVKKLLSRTTEDVSDNEETDSESEDGVRRAGNPGVGILWKMSFWATMSLFAYVFLSGPSIQANFVPDIVERDPISRITRPRNRRSRTNR